MLKQRERAIYFFLRDLHNFTDALKYVIIKLCVGRSGRLVLYIEKGEKNEKKNFGNNNNGNHGGIIYGTVCFCCRECGIRGKSV